MQRIDNPPSDLFIGGNPYTGVLGTKVTAPWLNSLQEEISKVVEEAGLALDENDNTQLWQALLGRFDLGGNVYIADCNETDQGVAGNGRTIKALIDTIGSDTGTIYLRHSSGSAQTIYNLTTDLNIPGNITFKREPGAIIDGTGKLTIVGIIGDYDRGQYFGSNLTVELTSASLQRFLFPEWWLIDGVADQVEINKALECAHTANTGYGGAASVILSSGKRYNIAGSIQIKHDCINLVSGVPSINAVIHRTMTTGNTLTIEPDTPASNMAQHIIVRGLNFYQTSAVPTAGAHIYMQSANYVTIENCQMIDGYYGIYMLGGVDCKIIDTLIKGTSLTTGTTLQTGCYLGKGTNANCDDVAALSIRGLRIEHTTGQECYSIGMHIAGADGVWVYDSHFGTHGSDTDLYISPGAGNHLAGVYFIGCYFDGSGVNLETTSSATYGLIQFKDSFFDGDGPVAGVVNGFHIKPTCDARDIQVHGCHFFNWNNHGIYVGSTAAKGISIINNHFYDNDKGGSGAAGIYFIDGISEFNIQNNFVGNSAGGGQNNSIVCGTSGGAGVSQCIISGNNCQNNTNDQIYVYGITGVKVIDNIDGSEALSIASAATITLPANGNYFVITGTTNITSVTSSWKGRVVTLRFSGTLTFTDGSNLYLSGNFVTAPHSTITIVSHDGAAWMEVSRSTN